MEPLEIGVPRQYRHGDADLDSLITDLPGLGAADPQEARAARELLEQHAAFADVVVICLKADQLSPVLPVHPLGVAVQPLLRVPDRIRIVITGAAHPPEVRRLRDPALEDLLEHYREELRTFSELAADGPVLRCAEGHLYLVDVGTSRSTDPADDGLLATVDASVELLRAGLAAGLVKESRYLTMAAVQRLFARHHQEEMTRSEAQVRAAEELLSRRAQELKEREQDLVRIRRDVEAADGQVERLRVVGEPVLRQVAPVAVDHPTGTSARAALAQTRDVFLSECKRAWSDWKNCVPSDVRAERWSALADGLGELFDDKVDCCGNCSGSFFSWFSDHPGVCVERTAKGCAEASEAAGRRLRKAAAKAVRPTVVENAAASAAARKRFETVERDVRCRQQDREEAESRLTGLREAHRAIAEEEAHANGRVRSLDGYLVQAVRDRRTAQLTALAASPEPIARLALALAIIRDREDLLGMRA